jgi:hypothetical protein
MRPGGPVAAASESGAGPAARLGQRLCRAGPRTDRRRAAPGPARQLPAARRPAGVRGGCDHLAALRRRELTRARLLLPSLPPLGRPADHRRLGLPVDRPAQLRARLLDRPGRRGAAAALGRHRPPSRRAGPRAPGAAACRRAGAGVVFDGGDDSAQLSLDLAEVPVAVLVRLRSDRCFEPTRHHGHPAARAGRVATGPSSTAPTRPPGRSRPPPWAVRTTSTAPSPSRRGRDCIPNSSATLATAPVGHGRSCAGPSCASRSNASRPRHVRRRCCGCGGPALAAVISIWPGGPMSAGSTWSTPSGSPSRPLAGRRQGRGIPPRPTGGPGWRWLPTPSCAWPARPPTTSGCRGRCRDPSRDCRPIGCAAGFRGCCAHSAHRLPRRNPADAPRAGPRAGLLGLQSATRRSRSPPRSPGRSNPRPPRPPDQSSPFHHR